MDSSRDLDPSREKNPEEERREEIGTEGSRPRLSLPALVSLSPRLRWAALSGLFALISGVLTYRFMVRHLPLSIVDEFQYIDAVNKAQRWDVVLTGDKTDQYARVLAACRGVGFGDPSTVIHQGACAPYVPDSDTFIYGYTSADIHSPAYFFLTGWMSWPLQRLLHMELITAARLTGAVWLWLGMVSLAWMLRRLGARWGVTVALPIAVASMPGFRLTNAYVTPDALNLLAGTLIIASMVLYVRGEWGIWPFIGISIVFSFVKFQNVFCVVAALVFLGWYVVTVLVRRHLTHHGDSDDAGGDGRLRLPRLWEGIALVVLPLAGSMIWMVIRSHAVAAVVDRPPLDPPANLDGLTVFSSMDDAYQLVFAGTGWSGVTSPWSIFPNVLVALLVAGTVATAMFDVRADVIERAFARSALLSCTAVGPMTILLFAIVFGASTGVLNRYVMVLIPVLVVPLCGRVTGRVAQGLLGVFAVGALYYAVHFTYIN
ncbi:hypothetical protein [Actinomyces viscosus]|uniref:Glycosyltransferase RgtA/B/C/D-like domain-containing protein n=1 Tax=Actinomyces viscosus TaxID=1656 RepID=A0A448PL86_ACTVI|nr:hypothetical protein [Actinomyces viscosus]VEI16110.1 Uncharacterised protein [Actinomyces viscosus]